MRHVRIFNLFVNNFLPPQPVRKTLSTCIHCGRFQLTSRVLPLPIFQQNYSTTSKRAPKYSRVHRPAEPSIAITKLASQGRPSEALTVYLQLIRDGEFPSQESLYQLTRSMYRASDLGGMFTIHDTLLSYYSHHPKPSNRSTRSIMYMYTMLINLIAKNTRPVDMSSIRSLCKEMTQFSSKANIVLYNTLIKTLLEQRQVDQAHAMYKELKVQQLQPTIKTFGILMKDASRRRDIVRLMGYLDEIEKHPSIKMDYAIVSIVVTTLCHMQEFEKAINLVEKINTTTRDELTSPKYRQQLLKLIEIRRHSSEQKKKKKRKKQHPFIYHNKK